MAGILDKKERMIDFLITKQGRRQMADGRMRIEYATLTDLHTFYEPTGSDQMPGVSEDASNRLFFEATGQTQDLIVPELEGGFSMQPFRTSDFVVSGRTVASGTFKMGTIEAAGETLTGSAIVTGSQKLLKSLYTNFQDLRILTTEDLFSDTSDFNLTAHTATFVITDNSLDFGAGRRSVYPDQEISASPVIELSNFPSIFGSERFNHLPNFKYMPPINVKTKTDEDPEPLGKYLQLATAQPLFSSREKLDQYLGGLQSLELTFTDTSRENNLICQAFEINNPTHQGIEKLAIVDMGEFQDSDPESPGTHVYSIGKVRKDSQGAHTYINLFTVVFD